MKYFCSFLVVAAAVWLLFFSRSDALRAIAQQPRTTAQQPRTTAQQPRTTAQQPRRWVSGDTLWWEIDSLPLLPSLHYFDSLQPLPHFDSSHYPFLLPSDRHLVPHWVGDTLLPIEVDFDYRLPFWNIYRRSITIWGITFSTGQANPYWPYPASRKMDAEVLSFPLQPPK